MSHDRIFQQGESSAYPVSGGTVNSRNFDVNIIRLIVGGVCTALASFLLAKVIHDERLNSFCPTGKYSASIECTHRRTIYFAHGDDGNGRWWFGVGTDGVMMMMMMRCFYSRYNGY